METEESIPQAFDSKVIEENKDDFFENENGNGAKSRQDSGVYRGHIANLDDNYFKKQMEFKAGKLF